MKVSKEYDKPVLSKMTKVLLSADKKHEGTVARYLSLGNRVLHEQIKKKQSDVWGVAGASYAIKSAFECKFGMFVVRDEPIRVKINF